MRNRRFCRAECRFFENQEQNSDQTVRIRPTLMLCVIAIFLASNTVLFGTYLAFIDAQLGILLKATAVGIVSWFVFSSLFAALHIASFVFSLRDLHLDRQAPRNYSKAPHVAVLYLCKDDLNETCLESCLRQDYVNYRTYILDDSCALSERMRIDAICDQASDRLSLIRRLNRNANHKAGNINNALRSLPSDVAYVCVVDSDEILPHDFVRETVAICEANSRLAFVQASHAQYGISQFGKKLGAAVDLHWKYYLTARNNRGFVYSFGHGVTFRVSALSQVGGFPEVVSEDLAVSAVLRQAGFRGYFASDIHCLEETPASYAAFRRRNRKIVLGTLQFLNHFYPRFFGDRAVTMIEKLDLLLASLIPLLPGTFFGLLIGLGLLSGIAIGQDVLYSTQTLGFGPLPQSAQAKLALVAGVTIFAPMIYILPSSLRAPISTIMSVARLSTIHLSLCADSFRATITWLRTGCATFQATGDRTQTAKSGFWESADQFFGIAALIVAVMLSSAFLAAVGLALYLVPAMFRGNLDDQRVSIVALFPMFLTIVGVLTGPETAVAAVGLLAGAALSHH